MKRRNPDDWFTGLTGASRNTGGPSNVVLGGYTQAYGLENACYGPGPVVRSSESEPSRISPVKQEPCIIILDDDDDTTSASQPPLPSFSRSQPLQREPTIEIMDDSPPRANVNRARNDPSVVILDAPPPAATDENPRKVLRTPTIEVVGGPTIAPPPAKRQRKAKVLDNVQSQHCADVRPVAESSPRTAPSLHSSNKPTPRIQSSRDNHSGLAHSPQTVREPSAGPSYTLALAGTASAVASSATFSSQPISNPVATASRPSNISHTVPTPRTAVAPAPMPTLPQSNKGKAPQTQPQSTTTQPRASREQKQKPEKRLAMMKKKCPNVTRERLERVTTQRFFMVDRKRVDKEDEMREEFQVLGSTGNVYTVTIQKVPSCNCPDALKGNHCKHILFIFAKVLQVPFESHVWYQKALLSTELQEIFANAPLAPNDVSNPRVQQAYARASGKTPQGATGKKRAIEEGTECPICYEDMFGVRESTLTFCEQCGNALHKECFGEWAKTKAADITCPFCRAKWPVTAANAGLRGNNAGVGAPYGEPYLNLANVAGLSPVRDTSTYYHGPRQGHRHMGYHRYGGF